VTPDVKPTEGGMDGKPVLLHPEVIVNAGAKVS
jgi:hypothetical protein